MGLRDEEEAMEICFWLLALFSLCVFVCEVLLSERALGSYNRI